MKITIRTTFAILLVAASFGCKKAELKEIDAIMQKGTWRISSFVEDSVDQTSDFTNYSFFFKSKTDVDATFDGQTVAGKWSTFRDDNVYKFELNFSTTAKPLEETNDDWDIVLFSSTKIELKDVSSDGSVDYLVFERN